MQPPQGFTFDPQSGKYYHSIEAVDPATGSKAQLVSWFDPQTGQTTKTAYPQGPQPPIVTKTAQKENRPRKSPLTVIVCILLFLCTVSLGAWKMGWLNPLLSNTSIPSGGNSTGQQGGGTTTPAGTPNEYQQWKSANLKTDIVDITGAFSNVVRVFYGDPSNVFEADPKFPNGKWLSEDGKCCILREKYTSIAGIPQDLVYIFLAYEPGDYGSNDSYGTISGPLINNADGSYSVGEQEIYPDLKITLSADLNITISGSPINTDTYKSDDFVDYKAESPYTTYKMVFNMDATPPPPENYKAMLNTTIPIPKGRGEEVEADLKLVGMYRAETADDIFLWLDRGDAKFQVRGKQGTGEIDLDKTLEEMMRDTEPQTIYGTSYFDGKYLFIDVEEVSDTTDDFKNSNLKEIVFGYDDEGNFVLLRDEIGTIKVGTVFWK